MTVGATVVTVCAGSGVCDGATVAGWVAVAVGGFVTAGSLDGTVMDDVPVAVAVDGADVAVDDEGVEPACDMRLRFRPVEAGDHRIAGFAPVR